jgi:hypothetical protein
MQELHAPQVSAFGTQAGGVIHLPTLQILPPEQLPLQVIVLPQPSLYVPHVP